MCHRMYLYAMILRFLYFYYLTGAVDAKYKNGCDAVYEMVEMETKKYNKHSKILCLLFVFLSEFRCDLSFFQSIFYFNISFILSCRRRCRCRHRQTHNNKRHPLNNNSMSSDSYFIRFQFL